MHGWIVLDKPVGLGSTQAVSAVKRAMRDAGCPRLKVGHGGTLDPLASGVLPVAIGEATKLAGRMLDSDKVYAFTIRFGEETDTLDTEGAVVATSEVLPRLDEIEAVLARFTGTVNQLPPAFSALKVDGQRAYDLARAGKEVTLETRTVTIHSLTRHPGLVRGLGEEQPQAPAEDRLPKQARHGEVTLIARVSKGTYIRSLARDIALALGTVGHVTMLRRLKAGPFGLDSAISLDKLAEMAKARALEDVTLPLTAGLDDIPALPVTPDQAGLLRQGRVLVGIAVDDGQYFATDAETPVALVEAKAREVRVVRGFNL